METLKGYVRAGEEIKTGDLVAILQKEDGSYVIYNCDDSVITK